MDAIELCNRTQLKCSAGLNAVSSNSHPSSPLVVITVPLLMFLCGAGGNCLALFVLCRSSREHKTNVFFRLVGGLACTDAFGILVLSPVTVTVYANGRRWIGGQPLCDYFSFFMIFSGISTVTIVGVMALERYCAVLQPYIYSRRFRPEKVRYILSTIWILSASVASLPFLGLGRNVLHYPGTWCFLDYHGLLLTDKVLTYFYAFYGLFVIGVTAVCNTVVMFVLIKMRQLVKKLNKHGRSTRVDNEAHMIILLAGIIFVFVTCYSPLMVRMIINQKRLYPVNHDFDLLAIRLASLNQILDPWVYILFRKRLFSKLWKLFNCSRERRFTGNQADKGADDKIRKVDIENGDDCHANEKGKKKLLSKDSTAKVEILSSKDSQKCQKHLN